MSSTLPGSVDRKEVESQLLKYVGIHSVNPGIDNGPGEVAMARELESDLREMGLETKRIRVADGGRDNVIGLLPGAPGSPIVMFESHLDTVGLSGDATADARSDGRLVFGRGACDTKGSLVSMLDALKLLMQVDQDHRPTVAMVGAIDEEFAGTGAEILVNSGETFDMAVVGEPTSLHVATAHKGVLRFEITTSGTPAHSSKPHLGINAIDDMALVLSQLESVYQPSLEAIKHDLVGSPTINVSTIRGGTAQNVVPAECVISIDRRVNPGETHDSILKDIDAALDPVRAEGIRVAVGEPTLATAALDTSTDHPLVAALSAAYKTDPAATQKLLERAAAAIAPT